MAIAIQHFTCTPLARKNLLTPDLKIELNEDEIAVLELIAHYDVSSIARKLEIEDIFSQMYEHVNLSRLVALNLLKYHINKPKRRPIDSMPSMPFFNDSFGSKDDYPLYHTHYHSSEISESDTINLSFSPTDFDSSCASSLRAQRSAPTPPEQINPVLHVVMGVFDDH